MRIGNSDLVKKCDNYCIEVLGIPGIILMENAALKVLKNIDCNENNSFVIVAGRGNNGGDALALARHLHVMGKHVEVFIVGMATMSKDCEKNYNILLKMGMKLYSINGVEDLEKLRDSINRSDLIVDGIFGTGLNRNVEGIFELVITVMNENGKRILSIDIPSGMDSEKGSVLGNCIRAHKTVSFQFLKEGFINYDTDQYCGEIIVEEIGIPESVISKFHDNIFMTDRELVSSKLKPRGKYGYKGDFGHVSIIAGSKQFTGAAKISTESAVKSGSGLVSLCTRKEVLDRIGGGLVEAMPCCIDNDEFLDILNKTDVVAIGPGMGNNTSTLEILKKVLESVDVPMVIDADGINVLEDNLSILKTHKNKIVLTPHLGEMSKICGKNIEEIRENRLEISRNFAREHDIILVLKGYNTVITDGCVTYINPTGNSSMANGGMGDCLTGIIASLIGQGYMALDAAILGVYIHGICGDKLSNERFVVNASDIIENIPYTLKELIRI